MAPTNPRTPLLVGTAIVAVVLLLVWPSDRGRTGASPTSPDGSVTRAASLGGTKVGPPATPDTVSSPVDPAAGEDDPKQGPLAADFVHLYDVSRSVHTGEPNDPFLRASRHLVPSIDALRDEELLLPQRHRVGTIGAASLMQEPLCDIRIEPPTLFSRTDTAATRSRIRLCADSLRARAAEGETDIHGALHYAALSLQGDRRLIRGIVLVTDLAEVEPAGQGKATPDLRRICVAVYSVVTPEVVAFPDSIAAREKAWRQQLLAWGAPKVRVQSSLGFSPQELASFFKSCRPR